MKKINFKIFYIGLSLFLLTILILSGLFIYFKVSNPNIVGNTINGKTYSVASKASQSIDWLDGKTGNYTFQNPTGASDDYQYTSFYNLKFQDGSRFINIRPLWDKFASIRGVDSEFYMTVNTIIEGQNIIYNIPMGVVSNFSVDENIDNFNLVNYGTSFKEQRDREKQEFESDKLRSKEEWNLQKINSLNFIQNIADSDFEIFKKLSEKSLDDLIVDSASIFFNDQSKFNKVIEDIARTGVKVKIEEVKEIDRNLALYTQTPTLKLKNQESTKFYKINNKYRDYLKILDEDRVVLREAGVRYSKLYESVKNRGGSEKELEGVSQIDPYKSIAPEPPLFKDSLDVVSIIQVSDEELVNNNRIFKFDPSIKVETNTPGNPSNQNEEVYSRTYLPLMNFERVEISYVQNLIDSLKTKKLVGEFGYLESILVEKAKTGMTNAEKSSMSASDEARLEADRQRERDFQAQYYPKSAQNVDSYNTSSPSSP
jgi:hypothetical protein